MSTIREPSVGGVGGDSDPVEPGGVRLKVSNGGETDKSGKLFDLVSTEG